MDVGGYQREQISFRVILGVPSFSTDMLAEQTSKREGHLQLVIEFQFPTEALIDRMEVSNKYSMSY